MALNISLNQRYCRAKACCSLAHYAVHEMDDFAFHVQEGT